MDEKGIVLTESNGMDIKQTVDEKTVEEYLFATDTKLTEKQKKLFLALSVRNNLDPFKREIYAIPFGKGFNIVTGYQAYIQRAERTGLLNGWNVVAKHDDKGILTGAEITIYRKDWDNPFVWNVTMKEFNRDFGVWKTMPEFMIKKVAICQGFRLAFPEELGGLPYTEDELPNKPVEIQKESKVSKKEPQNFKFLQEMKRVKEKVGEAVYYTVLNKYGFNKSSEITDRNIATKVYKELISIKPKQQQQNDDIIEVESESGPGF